MPDQGNGDKLVDREYLDSLKQLYDERFKRDRELISELSDAQKQTTLAITDISKTLSKLDSIISKHEDYLDETREFVKEIKKHPSNIMDKIVSAIITAIISGSVSFIVAQLLHSAG